MSNEIIESLKMVSLKLDTANQKIISMEDRLNVLEARLKHHTNNMGGHKI